MSRFDSVTSEGLSYIFVVVSNVIIVFDKINANTNGKRIGKRNKQS